LRRAQPDRRRAAAVALATAGARTAQDLRSSVPSPSRRFAPGPSLSRKAARGEGQARRNSGKFCTVRAPAVAHANR